MKYCIVLLVLAELTACTSPEKPAEKSLEVINKLPDSLLIKPGESIGNIKLDDDMQALTMQSGKPDENDAAMGSASYTWFARHDAAGYRTSVYGHRNFGAADENIMHIKKILVNSPTYVTSDGIHTGTGRDSLNRFFQLTDSSKYSVKGKIVHVFADVSKGIAFEIDSLTRKCTAISIFKPSDTSAVYINMY